MFLCAFNVILMCFLLAIKLPKLSQNFLVSKQRCFNSAFDLNLEKMVLNLVSLMHFYDLVEAVCINKTIQSFS